MKLTTYFINHPVIAIILNALIVVSGFLCWNNLPVREYPQISFPTITVSAHYPNASPELVESSVTNILEDSLAGIEGLDTIASQSNSGRSEITLVFRAGTVMDRALAATQDAVGIARASLPKEVNSPSIERQRKSSGLPFIGIALESTALGFGELTHYANVNFKNVFRSLPGVSSVEVWGQPFTYAIRLDAQKLFSFGVNVNEVVGALSRSHVSLPVGKYRNQIPSTLQFELLKQSDYENLLIKADEKNPVFLKSVANVNQETDTTRTRLRINGHAGVIISIERANDANPVDVSKAVRHTLKTLQQSLPPTMTLVVTMDQSDFINASIKNIRSAIVEAIVLVLIIVFFFLRNIWATFIPLVTIPVSLLGSLIFLNMFGFSINLMTLLAMVLAIGLVVDDAIVVLENIWRHKEEGQSAREAAILGGREIGFAIVAMTLTLVSVYLPIAFIHGMLGQLFVEFSVALAGSVLISGLVALTLSPLMCATFLGSNATHWWPGIDKMLDKLSSGYGRVLSLVLMRPHRALIAALISIAVSGLLYHVLTEETAPKEDRGLISVALPSLPDEEIDILDAKMGAVEKKLGTIPEAAGKLTFMGNWGGMIVLPLKPHAQRTRRASAIVESLKPTLNHFPSLDPKIWSRDTGLPGIADQGHGSDLSLVISTTDSFKHLFEAVEKLKKGLDASKQFASTDFELRLDTRGYSIEIDYNQLAKLGLTAMEVAKTIEVFFSGDKTQSFEKDGVVYYLMIKGMSMPWTLNELYLTTPKGKRISLGAITHMALKAQPASLEHFQQQRATTLNITLHKRQSLADAADKVWNIAKKNLPEHYKLTWTGAVKTLQDSSSTMAFLFIFSLMFIYAVLAIQFENFSDPCIILFTVPLACLGALGFTYVFDQSLSIYTQIGLITLVGLISKHGILIVEFANQQQKKGVALVQAVHNAAVLRLRPILMTTGAMVFGAIPLVLSHDAGSEAHHAIGIVLIGGLCTGTLFTLLVLPAVYLWVKTRVGTR